MRAKFDQKIGDRFCRFIRNGDGETEPTLRRSRV
jgi:hypothetical protein